MFGSRILPPVHVPMMPPGPGCSDLQWARYAQREGVATIDDIWVLREHEQERRNAQRAADWKIRFKVLGPRPGDLPGSEQ